MHVLFIKYWIVIKIIHYFDFHKKIDTLKIIINNSNYEKIHKYYINIKLYIIIY